MGRRHREHRSDLARLDYRPGHARVRQMNGEDRISPLHRASGLGSAKSGVSHWWLQRLTAVALIPLVLWLVAALIHLAGSDHRHFIDWLSSPTTAVLMVLLLIALFRHTVLGLQVVIEDYVHSILAKTILIALMQFAGFALAISGIL